MDTTVMVCGESRDEGMHMDPPMAVSFCDDKNGYMLSTLIDPWLLYPLIHTWHGPRNPLRFLRYGKTLGIMIKLKDEISGGIRLEAWFNRQRSCSVRDLEILPSTLMPPEISSFNLIMMPRVLPYRRNRRGFLGPCHV